MITQSSSATNGIVIVMVAANPSLLASGFYLVIGSTIGALMPTLLACLKGNNLAKRVTYSTIILRALIALLVTVIIWIVSGPLFSWLGNFPQKDVGILLALFTIIYNFVYIVILLPLVTPIEKLSKKLFKDKDEERKKKSLLFINDNLLNTPAVALIQVKKEIENMFELAKTNFFLGMNFVYTQDLAKAKELEDREEKVDFINNEISNYLIKVSSHAALYDERRIGSYYHVINDIERIGDHAYNFLEMSRKMKNEDLVFSDIAIKEFKEFEDIIRKMFLLADKIFMDKNMQDLEELHKLEDETDALTDKLSTAHFNRIKNKQCKNELSPFHSNLLSELERVADHLTNIGYSIVNPTGDESTHNE